tara:strand:+ start:5057 stop:6331 length:1275 start_codon:yes stop_codon:yes gene_type:complete
MIQEPTGNLIAKVPSEKPWVLIAAYDVSTGNSSEGHVAFCLLSELCKTHRIILITRKNNKMKIENGSIFKQKCPGVYLVGYDLPKWASFWKRGALFYQAYAYLWQMTWPLILKKYNRILRELGLVHVLNFHNDSIPSLAWLLGLPVVWGPINHNEQIPPWRRDLWPQRVSMKYTAAFSIRKVLWRIDPFLKLHIRRCSVVLAAGQWVDQRLDLQHSKKVIYRSQLGFSEGLFKVVKSIPKEIDQNHIELICAGRLDWIKGLDLAVEALAQLPAQYRLRLVGSGPAESTLRVLISKLGLKDRVIIQPPVAREVLPYLYAESSLFLFPSAEVAGLVWVEALASGLPVVAFDGLTEVAAAANYLPGIQLATATCERKTQVEGYAAAIKTAQCTDYDPLQLSEAVLAYYGWKSLADTVVMAYGHARGE